MEERRAWTVRGIPNPETGNIMSNDDLAVIRAVAKKDKKAARIFVTGEVHEGYIGEEAVKLLININDTLTALNLSKEPLFTETADTTVRMLRFNPTEVWKCIHPDLLMELVKEEATRLSIDMDPHVMEHFDFYESLIHEMKKENKGLIIPISEPEHNIVWYYHSVYLACLLLFKKPNYMDVPVATHFSDPSATKYFRELKCRPINSAELAKVEELREQYGKIQALTNQELRFVIGLYR